ncbi:hypothetical protein MBLNU230_g3722t1 [Neophaeotheca triangularis]
MAPKRGQSIEPSEERENFIKDVAEFHQTRGTNFDPEPKVGVRHIDLHRLYKRVVDEGGYDLVSDTKAKPLMWRRFAEEFVGKNQYTTAQAFQMKNTYYKNLVSYEIKNHWEKEPPPKEIVEDVTAKGANVMSRTLENFERPAPKEQQDLQSGDQSDASPEQKTPKAEQAEDGEGPGSATGGRTTRGLRQQPPQRVLFQPDLTASRQPRGSNSVPQPSPTPNYGTNGMMSHSLTNGASTTLASYEPSQSYPLTLKPVTTPGNNPEYYRNERKRKLEASAGELAKKYRNIMLPGTGFIGPNIYVRAQLALQSGLPEEESFALHHLVKISHERGDKYRFDQFPGLAESLVKKALQVSSLFYDVDWNIDYDGNNDYPDDETLNGLGETPHLLEKLGSHQPGAFREHVEDAETTSKRHRIIEAGLILRNMCMLEHNAQYLSEQRLVRDYLAITLSLPNTESTIEMKHHALDTAEQVVKYANIGRNDTLYHMLLIQLDERGDRGTLTAALRAISRIGDKLPTPKLIEGIPPRVLQNVADWLLLPDEELRSACLDFLSSYTSFGVNVTHLLESVDAEGLAQQLSKLLLFDAKEYKSQQSTEKNREPQDTEPAPVPRLSHGLVQQLLALEEPARSSEWLRMCFVSDPTAEMTQISLWQAYQGTFAPYQATHPHLIAGEFIKNVSATFTGATAQVAGANKYVIKGIRSRNVPVNGSLLPGTLASEKGKELQKCSWNVTVPVDGPRDAVTGDPTGPITKDVECSEWFRDGATMLSHIVSHHLIVPKARSSGTPTPQPGDAMDIDAPTNGTIPKPNSNSDSAYDWLAADKTTYQCRWGSCIRTSADFEATENIPRTLLFARHIQTHLPDSSSFRKTNITPHNKPASPETTRTTYATLTDEVGEAAGIPLGAATVLRNIARFFPQEPSSNNGYGTKVQVDPEGGANTKRLAQMSSEDTRDARLAQIFNDEVRGCLFFALANNTVLRREVDSVLRAVGKVEKGE